MNKIFITYQDGGVRSGDVIGYALAEDGDNLASHLCSGQHHVRHDMGITSDWKHETYNKKYPEGYELVWVGEVFDAIKENKEFANVVELNQKYV